MLDDFDLEVPEEGSPPEESDNRTFLIVAGGLGAFMLVSLICLALIFVLRGPADPDAAAATINAQNTEVAQAITETAQAAAAFTFTPSNTPIGFISPTVTSTPSPTGAITNTTEATVETPTEGPTTDPRTATVQALLTQASIAQTQAAQSLLTVTPTATPTGLPDTGFADDVGIPGLIALSGILILVIVFARRLRAVNA
jgi:hypothetical protein